MGEHLEKGGVNMPTYEFYCRNCKKSVALTMTVGQYEAKDYRCPECGEKKLKQQVSHFQTKTSKKS
jgi:putative FmdB family regulatory protein